MFYLISILAVSLMSRHKVVIIGAGCAGLAAAVRLQRRHALEEVIILEAAEGGVGGRVHSAQLRGGGPRVERGAQWIHGQEGNVAHAIAADLGFLDTGAGGGEGEQHCEHEALCILSGRAVPQDEVKTLTMALSSVEEAAQKIPEDCWPQYSSLRDYVERAAEELLASCDLDPSLKAAYLHWWGQLQACIDGARDMADTAVYQNLVYRECPGNLTTTLARGRTYQQLIETYAASVLDKVSLGKRVVKIRYSEEEVEVLTEDGSQYACDVCIATLPLGVLKQEHRSLFDPELPEYKISAIECMGFGTVVKIFILFDISLCEVEGFVSEGFNFLRESSEHEDWTDSVFGLYPDQAEDRALVAWLSGPGTEEVEALGEAAVLAGVTRLLDTFLRPVVPALPRPRSCRVTSWGSDPRTRGAYSYLGPATPPDTPSVLGRPLAGGRLLVAGEATHEKFFGTVHGAIETGWREADRAARVLGIRDREDCPTIPAEDEIQLKRI